MDPNDTNAGQTVDEAATSVADIDTTVQPGADPPQATEAETAAFDRGIASVDPSPNPEGDGADGESKDKGDDQGEPEAAVGTPVARTEQEMALEKEISDLGIKNERTQARFRELATKAAEAETLRVRAQRADEWEETVTSTGATPEQFGKSMQYLADVCSGDPQRMSRAHDLLVQELQVLGKLLGKPAPGVDVLESHADLRAAVESGDMTRQFAEELASRRAAEAIAQRNRTARDEQTGHQEAVRAGTAAVAALGQKLRAADPVGFDAKFKILAPIVDRIQKTLPPSQWAAAIHDAWQAAPIVAPPRPKPPISQQPLRPTGASTGQQRKPRNDEEAFSFGVDAAKAAGF